MSELSVLHNNMLRIQNYYNENPIKPDEDVVEVIVDKEQPLDCLPVLQHLHQLQDTSLRVGKSEVGYEPTR